MAYDDEDNTYERTYATERYGEKQNLQSCQEKKRQE